MFEQESLTGLDGLHVMVETIDFDGTADRPSKPLLLDDVSTMLSEQGIPVLSAIEGIHAPGSPYLYVHVDALVDGHRALLGYQVSLALRQRVQLVRDPSIALTDPTWDAVLVVDDECTQTSLRRTVKELVRMFLSDYQLANPHRQS